LCDPQLFFSLKSNQEHSKATSNYYLYNKAEGLSVNLWIQVCAISVTGVCMICSWKEASDSRSSGYRAITIQKYGKANNKIVSDVLNQRYIEVTERKSSAGMSRIRPWKRPLRSHRGTSS
jgi:hypothetical protein